MKFLSRLKFCLLPFFYGLSMPTTVPAQEACHDMSNAERGGCLGRYGDFLEGEMVKAYIELDRILTQLTEQYGASAKALKNGLQPSQAAFETYRLHQCIFDNTVLLGNGGGNATLMCKNAMTSERIEYLRNRADQFRDL